MLHHVSLGVRAIDASATFYDAALGALGDVRVWSDLEPGTRDQAVGYGRPGGEGCLALERVMSVEVRCVGRQRWTPSIALRYRTAAVAMANQACDRTMATISTPRSSSTPTGTTSKRWSPASRHAQRQHRDPRPAWRWLEARTRGTLTAQ
ncbi:lactoylglutathione lyase [Xanthomonas citri pv. citri]